MSCAYYKENALRYVVSYFATLGWVALVFGAHPRDTWLYGIIGFVLVELFYARSYLGRWWKARRRARVLAEIEREHGTEAAWRAFWDAYGKVER